MYTQILSKSSSSRPNAGRSEGKDDDDDNDTHPTASPTRPSTTRPTTTSHNTTYTTPQQVYYDLGIRQLKIWLEEDEDKGHEQARIDREEKAREARSTHEEFVKKKNRYIHYSLYTTHYTTLHLLPSFLSYTLIHFINLFYLYLNTGIGHNSDPSSLTYIVSVSKCPNNSPPPPLIPIINYPPCLMVKK